MRAWVSLVFLVVFVAACAAALVLVHRFTNSEFLLGVLGFVVATMTASFQYKAAKDNETNARLFTQKQEVYTDLIETLMGLFHEKKLNPTEVEQAALVKKLQNIRTKLLVWGSAATIQALDRMADIQPVSGERLPVTGTLWMSQLFAAIRKDLGHNDPPDAGKEMALGMLIPGDREVMRDALARSVRATR